MYIQVFKMSSNLLNSSSNMIFRNCYWTDFLQIRVRQTSWTCGLCYVVFWSAWSISAVMVSEETFLEEWATIPREPPIKHLAGACSLVHYDNGAVSDLLQLFLLMLNSSFSVIGFLTRRLMIPLQFDFVFDSALMCLILHCDLIVEYIGPEQVLRGCFAFASHLQLCTFKPLGWHTQCFHAQTPWH